MRSGGCSTSGSSRCESTDVSPCPGKCLPHAATPLSCSRRMIAAPSRATLSASLRQRAVADDRVLRIGVDVEHRRVVERDADGTQLGGQRCGEPPRQRRVAAAPERGHRRPHRERRLQPRHPPALLIDAHPERQPRRQRLHVVRELGHLLGRLDVARKEDDAAQRELARERSHLGGDRLSPAGCRSSSCPMSRRMDAGHAVHYSCRSVVRVRIVRPRAPTSTTRLAPDPHRSRGRHDRHLASLSLPSRRADAERGDQPPRPRADRIARPTRASSSARRTPAPRVEADDWRELGDEPRAAAALAARPFLRGARHHADDHVGVAGRRRHRRVVGAERGRVRGAGRLEARRTTSPRRCCRWP